MTSIQFLGTSENIVSCGGDQTVRYHRTSNRQNYRNFSGNTDYVYSVAATPDEKLVIAGGEDGIVRVWNGENGQSLYTFNPPAPPAEPTQVQASDREEIILHRFELDVHSASRQTISWRLAVFIWSVSCERPGTSGWLAAGSASRTGASALRLIRRLRLRLKLDHYMA